MKHLYLAVVILSIFFAFNAEASVFGPRKAVPVVKKQQHDYPLRTVTAEFTFPFKKSSPSVVEFERRGFREFSNRDSRVAFIRKVYSIFTTQIAATAAVIYLIINDRHVSKFLHQNLEHIQYGGAGVSLLSLLALLSKTIRLSKPWNFLVLGAFTASNSILLGLLASQFDPKTVLLGGMHTLSVMAAVTLFSFQPKAQWDLTTLGTTLLASLVSLGVGAALNEHFQFPLQDNIISGLSAVLFAVYLAYDTQMVVGGKSTRRQYSSREYILASLNLYTDVINIFADLLRLLGRKEKNNRR